jgi:hypothetical protein
MSRASDAHKEMASQYHMKYEQLQGQIEILERLAKERTPNKATQKGWLANYETRAGVTYKDMCAERDALMNASSHHALMSLMHR